MCEGPKTILRNCKSFTFSTPLDENLLDGCLKDLTNINRNRKSRRKRRGKHARLPARMPASHVPKNPVATKDRSGRTQCQAEKTGIVEQVTRWQDSKTGLKGDHAYLDEDKNA